MQSSNRGNSDIEKSQVGETSASQTTSNFGITETPAQQVAFSTEFIEPTQSRPTPYISPPGLTASWQSLPDLPRAVNTFLIDPSDKSVVYAGTGDYSGSGSGVFKSIDAGKTWTPASNGLPNEQALVLASSGQPGTPLFVAIGSQIYRSLDGAQSWEPLGDAAIFPSYEPIELIVMPDSQRLFTAATGGGVTRSEDGGNTWLPSNDGLPKQSDIDRTGITAMARDPVDENILYVGIGGFVGQGAGVYKSVDGGLSWQPANRRILDQRITALAVSPNDSQVIYAGSDRGELFKSIDGGENWMDLTNRIRGLQFWDPRQIRKILINPSTSEQVVMLGDAAGIMVSDDAGESWQSLGQIGENDQPMFTSMAVFFDEGQTMLVGIDRDGAWRRALGPALVIQPTGTSQSSPQATSENALHPTGSWQALEDLPSAVNSFVMNSGNLDVFMAGAGSYSQAGGIYLSSDLGLTWSSAPNWTRTEAIMALANTQISPPITYAATNASQIYSSMDNGENWTLLGNYGLSTYSECHLYITPNDGNFTLFLVASGSGLTRSQDGGYSWQLLKQGLPSNEDYVYAQSLAIDPENPNIVYLGTGGFVGQGYGIYKSTDGGDSWFPSNQGMLDRRITAMAIDPADANAIFAGSDQGELYKSNDGGQSWSDLSELLKGQAFWDPRQIRKILFDPGAPGTIYLLADASGIFYSLNGGASWRLLGKPGEEDYPMFTDMAVNFGLQPIILVGMQDKGAWRYGQMD